MHLADVVKHMPHLKTFTILSLCHKSTAMVPDWRARLKALDMSLQKLEELRGPPELIPSLVPNCNLVKVQMVAMHSKALSIISILPILYGVVSVILELPCNNDNNDLLINTLLQNFKGTNLVFVGSWHLAVCFLYCLWWFDD